MRSNCKLKRELDSFITKAVAKAKALSGPQVDLEDLQQVVQLAILEAESKMPSLEPAHHLRFLRRRILAALKAEVAVFRRNEPVEHTLDELIEQEAEDLIGLDRIRADWDGDSSDDSVAKIEVAHHVREVVDSMPTETAQVVRLCFGLDGGDAVEPIDVADILDEPPETVLSHLWAAEKLFRHFSDEGRHRRLTPMTTLEFEAFYSVRDLAWYDLRDIHLNNADLRNCNLSNAVLSGMNLWGVKLAGADVSQANLWGALLDGADLRDADLQGANLERASLRGADLRGADLRGANLWGADLSDAKVDHADLAEADLRSTNLIDADLTRTQLSRSDLRSADLRRSKLVGAELVGANLQGAELSRTDLRWADLRNSDLCWANLTAADFRGASMQGAVRSPKVVNPFVGRAPRPNRLRPVANSA